MVRWGSALSVLAIALLWTLLVIFVVDWLFDLTRVQRLVAIGAGIVTLLWSTRRHVLPEVRQTETDLDMALMVERQKGIDSDLVAALQFETPGAKDWGSNHLQTAVIDYVAEFSRGLNVYEGFSAAALVRRAGILLATLALVALGIVLFPNHARTFFNRLALGSQHYPTRTHIDTVLINRRPIELTADAVAARSPYGQAVRFTVVGSGELPVGGKVIVTTRGGGSTKEVELLRDTTKPVLMKVADKDVLRELPLDPAVDDVTYSGSLPQLLDDVSFKVELGDAYTDAIDLQLVPLPVVELKLTATPPEYALHIKEGADAIQSAQQLSVIEGSQVALELTSSNKPLKKAVLVIDEKSYPLSAVDSAAKHWKLDSDNTPLARVLAPVKYRLVVEDEDGLSPLHSLDGYIRIRADRKPTVGADVVALHWLPGATPQIDFKAGDDIGLSKLAMHLEVTRHNEAKSNDTKPNETGVTAVETLKVWKAGANVAGDSGTYPLKLDRYKLNKGDQVKLILEATDYRGGETGKSTLSEPLVLHITDESGIFAASAELDERSARQLDAIMKLETGGSR